MVRVHWRWFMVSPDDRTSSRPDDVAMTVSVVMTMSVANDHVTMRSDNHPSMAAVAVAVTAVAVAVAVMAVVATEAETETMAAMAMAMAMTVTVTVTVSNESMAGWASALQHAVTHLIGAPPTSEQAAATVGDHVAGGDVVATMRGNLDPAPSGDYHSSTVSTSSSAYYSSPHNDSTSDVSDHSTTVDASSAYHSSPCKNDPAPAVSAVPAMATTMTAAAATAAAAVRAEMRVLSTLGSFLSFLCQILLLQLHLHCGFALQLALVRPLLQGLCSCGRFVCFLSAFVATLLSDAILPLLFAFSLATLLLFGVRFHKSFHVLLPMRSCSDFVATLFVASVLELVGVFSFHTVLVFSATFTSLPTSFRLSSSLNTLCVELVRFGASLLMGLLSGKTFALVLLAPKLGGSALDPSFSVSSVLGFALALRHRFLCDLLLLAHFNLSVPSGADDALPVVLFLAAALPPLGVLFDLLLPLDMLTVVSGSFVLAESQPLASFFLLLAHCSVVRSQFFLPQSSKLLEFGLPC